MSLCFQLKGVPLSENGPTGYLHLFRLRDTGVKTSLGNDRQIGEIFMFTYSGHSFVFHRDLLKSYITTEQFFSRNQTDTSVECTFCNQKNPYSLVTFYKLRHPDIKNELEYDTIRSLLHAEDRKPLCDKCMSKILDATINQLLIGSGDIVSKII